MIIGFLQASSESSRTVTWQTGEEQHHKEEEDRGGQSVVSWWRVSIVLVTVSVCVDVCVCLQELSLDHVFGYRGFDCRNNLHYLNDGADIIFHTAAAAVIQNLSAGTVLTSDLWLSVSAWKTQLEIVEFDWVCGRVFWD